MNAAATSSTFSCLKKITSFPILVMTLKDVFRTLSNLYDGALILYQ